MENYYSILGISQNDTAEDIKKAYLRLAQKFHPDRFQDPDEKQKAHEQFSKITESYRVLSDDQLKAEYDRSLEKGIKPKEVARETQAKNAFKRAIVFLRQNDPWRAVNLLRIANRYHPQPLYLSYLGLALVYTKQYQQEGFEKLKQAAKDVMFNPIFHVNLGLAYEYTGKRGEALESYYEALNWDGSNVPAKKGIERLEEKKKGFFSKLFGGGK
jgi:curved DNA-binding protein CbpA